MTKKDYIAIASLIKKHVEANYILGKKVIVTSHFIDDLGNLFIKDNNKFNKSRFTKACGAELL